MGYTEIFLLINASYYRKNKSINPLRVRLSNGDIMESMYTALLEIPELSKSSLLAHVLLGIENNSMLPVGQLRNEGYYVTFKIDGVTIFNSKSNNIMRGNRDLDTGLWCTNLFPQNKQTQISEANNVYELHNTDELVSYLHKALLRPTKPALLKAIEKFTS